MIVCIGLLSVLAISRATALEYRLHVLDPLPGHHACAATNINNQRQIVGFSESDPGSPNGWTAVLWSGSAPQSLGIRGDRDAVTLNDFGTVAAAQYLWQNGTKTKLPTLIQEPYGRNSFHGINNRGEVVGQSMDLSAGTSEAAFWDSTGVHALETPYFHTSAPYDINDSGLIVGAEDEGTLGSQAVVWQGGRIRVLPTATGYDASSAVAVNNAGLVVGNSCRRVYVHNDFYYQYEMCIWQDDSITEVPIPGLNGTGDDVNDSGQVVGSAWYEDVSRTDISKAFIWADGALTWLPDLGGWTMPSAINNSGWIVGRSYDTDHVLHAVVWEPVVPEPAGPVVLLGGVAALPLVLRRVSLS